MLLAGTYEKKVLVYRLKPAAATLSRHLAHLNHTAPVTCAAAAGPIGVTADSVETIYCYDMSSNTPLGHFVNSSAVAALAFYTPQGLSFPRNLVSGNGDGSISIFDASPFVCLKSVEVHRRTVNDLAVHSSGKLALSVGADKCLAVTNLMRGRRSFYAGIGKEGTLVKFIDDEKFFMVKDVNVGVHNMDDAKLIVEFECPKRVLSAAPGERNLLFTGGEDRNITAWDINSGKVAYCIEGAHSSRIKGIVALTRNSGHADDDHPYLLASGSSDGVIRVWDVRKASAEKPNPLAEVDIQARLTCFAGSYLKSFKQPGTGKTVTSEAHDESADGS